MFKYTLQAVVNYCLHTKYRYRATGVGIVAFTISIATGVEVVAFTISIATRVEVVAALQ